MIKICMKVLGRATQRFRCDDNGATAVEFAMIVGPFFALLFAVLESTTIFFATATLENGVLEVSRMVKTGQAQEAELSASDFKTELCDRVSALMDCDRIVVDVQTFEDLGSVSFASAIDDTGAFAIDPQFDAGSAGDIILIRAFYTWKVFTPGVGFAMANMSDGTERLIVASTAFRNEPFDSSLGGN